LAIDQCREKNIGGRLQGLMLSRRPLIIGGEMRLVTVLIMITAMTGAIFGAPSGASAGTWSIGNAEAFTFHSPNAAFSATNGFTVSCITATGTGSYTSSTGGTLKLTFHGCKESLFGFSCNSSGQPSGTILTTTLSFTNVYLSPGQTDPGITLKGSGAEEHIASFTCGGFPYRIDGTVLGEVEDLCGTISNKLHLNFESSSHGVQRDMQVTGAGSKEDLTMTINAKLLTGALDSTGTMTFGNTHLVPCS
jgi:hypothetical protein